MSTRPTNSMAMKSTAQPAPKIEKEKKGLGRVFLSKVKTVWKKGEAASSKRQSILPTTTTTTTTATVNATATATATATTVPIAVITSPIPADTTESATKSAATALSRFAEARARYEGVQGVTKLSRSALFEQRAKNLSERFSLEIHPSEWQVSVPDDTVLRMDKPIRMRIRRTCHRCNATFASTKECPNCQHVRCTKCTRYPPKRTEAEILASREKRTAILKANKENAPIIPDYGWEEKEVVFKRPSKNGGQDLVYKKPRQRVRRTCHECKTLFMAGSKTCEKCSHIRCTDCPRDPPKKDKYPFGYPGDAFGPSSIPHFECELCKTLYPTGAENGTECKKCHRPKSDKSPRALPRKVEPLPDPEVLQQIQAKLGNMKIT